jgi:uncharacterized iron-regulated membrane protein
MAAQRPLDAVPSTPPTAACSPRTTRWRCPRAAQVFNGAYPLHAAKVGGLAYRLLMTLSGLALALLGSLTVWTFWFKRPRQKRPR